jgi:chemotaxis protein MotB
MNAFEATPSGAGSPVWLITFADLIGLMLCFFVMLFSMSTIEEGSWRRIAGAVDNGPTDRTVRADSPVVVDRNMSATPSTQGRDVGYLAALLQRRLAQDAALSSVGLSAREDRVALLLPAEKLFGASSAVLRGGAEPLLTALAGVLRNVPNRIVVDGYVDPAARDVTRFASAWAEAVSRADAVSRSLQAGGYPFLPEARARLAIGASGLGPVPAAGAIAVVVLDSSEDRP